MNCLLAKTNVFRCRRYVEIYTTQKYKNSLLFWILNLLYIVEIDSSVFKISASELIFVVLNLNEHFKLVDSGPQLNLLELFRKKCSSDSIVYYQPSCKIVLSIFKAYHSIS